MAEYRIHYVTFTGAAAGGVTRHSLEQARAIARQYQARSDVRSVKVYQRDDYSDWEEIEFDDIDEQLLSLAQIASALGYNKSFLQAEAKRGNLKATKVGNSYVVRRLDLELWMANPRRGTVSTARKSDDQA